MITEQTGGLYTMQSFDGRPQQPYTQKKKPEEKTHRNCSGRRTTRKGKTTLSVACSLVGRGCVYYYYTFSVVVATLQTIKLFSLSS